MIVGLTTGEGQWSFDATGNVLPIAVRVQCDRPGRVVTTGGNDSSVPSAVVLRITTLAGMGAMFEAWCRPGESVPLPPSAGRIIVDAIRDGGEGGFGLYATPDAWQYEANAPGQFGVCFAPELNTRSAWRVDRWVPYPPDEALRVAVAPPPHARRFRLHACDGETGSRWIEHGSWAIVRETFGIAISPRDVAAALGGRWIECAEPIVLCPNPVGAPVPHDLTSVLRIEWECEL